jgi:hypothetical protein
MDRLARGFRPGQQILQKLWERAEENLRAELLKSKLLLSHDNLGQTARHQAASWGYVDVLHKVLEWGKKI